MMDNIDIIRYILKNHPTELTKGRLNKLVYLADWKAAIDIKEQISSIKWKFNHYGPYVDDIENLVYQDDRFIIKAQTTIYGNDKYVINLLRDSGFNEPNAREKKILDFIIQITKNLSWSKFINAVYSTYPVKSSERGTFLDLVKLSEEYKRSKTGNN